MNNIRNQFSNQNKFRNIRQTYNGYSYASRLEARTAANLDMMKKAIDKRQRVEKWERQHKIDLRVNGIHIANYFVDFKVWFTDGRIEFWESKGMETDVFRIKFALTKAIYPEYNLVLIK